MTHVFNTKYIHSAYFIYAKTVNIIYIFTRRILFMQESMLYVIYDLQFTRSTWISLPTSSLHHGSQPLARTSCQPR
jgi:hypothetical protein